MKRLASLLLALVLTLGCMAGICFAEDPIAVVINGSEETRVVSGAEIEALLSPEGTTVVKMLRDCVAEPRFVYEGTTFTLDLNGYKMETPSTGVRVMTLGTKNTTTVIKNGVLVGGKGTTVGVRINVGGMRLENVVCTVASSSNTVVGIYETDPKYNADNVITGCTIVGYSNSAVAYNSTAAAQTEVSCTIENSVLLNARGDMGTYPINQRELPGGTINLGKNVHIYAKENTGWIHPELKTAGEAVSFLGKGGAFKVPALGYEFSGLYHWATADGGLKNSTCEVLTDTIAEEDTPKTAPVVASVATFADVPTTFWGFDAIDAAYCAGLVKGKSAAADGKMNYAPNDTMTRAEFLTTVMRFFYADEAAKVSQDGAKWWQGYYELALSKGVLKEGELNNGDMDKAMTREEMALALYRTAPSAKGYADVKRSSTAAIPDYKTVANVYKEAVLWVYGAGLIQGMDARGTFKPQESLTRAQSATVLAKLVRTENAAVEIVLPEISMEETAENRQKALLATAKAYYNKGVAVQYDWITISRAGRDWGCRYYADLDRNSPEYASADMTIYSVCSHFVNMVTERALGYLLMGSRLRTGTSLLAAVTPEQVGDIFVFQYDNTGDAAKDEAAMKEAMSLMQPGDIVTYVRGGDDSGHATMYAGDITGDGKGDIIHCSDPGGGRYDVETGIDKKEVNGGIFINNPPKANDAETFFTSTAFEGQSYLATTTCYSIIRPVVLDSKEYPISEDAKTRMTYPDLTVTYTTDTGFYGAVEKGQYITYTLTLGNKSAQDHKGLKVQIPTLENATLSHVDGKEFKENLAVLSVDVPAGQEVTHTFTFKAVGNVGERITSTGYVHTLPLPQMHIAITSHTPTKAQFQAEAVIAKAVTAANSAEAYAEAYYEAATGKDVSLPTIQALLDAGFSKSGNNYYTPLDNPTEAICGMFVTDYYGGRNLKEDVLTTHRIMETLSQDVLPGDILYVVDDMADLSTTETWVFDGESYRALQAGKLMLRSSLDVMKLHSYDFFCLLRPSQIG